MAVSQKFNATFALYCGLAPVQYLQALAKLESNFNPRDQTGKHRGLLQVSPATLDDWNKVSVIDYTLEDLFVPSVNVKLWCWWLSRFQKAADELDIAPLDKPDWDDPEYVKLVTAAWNSGWSKESGVLFMAKWLADAGLKVTHDNVFKYAKQAGATRHLSNRTKKEWQKRVANLYFELKFKSLLPFPAPTEELGPAAYDELIREAEKQDQARPTGGNKWGVMVLLLLLLSER